MAIQDPQRPNFKSKSNLTLTGIIYPDETPTASAKPGSQSELQVPDKLVVHWDFLLGVAVEHHESPGAAT